MKRNIAVLMSATSLLLAGTIAASAYHHHYRPARGAYYSYGMAAPFGGYMAAPFGGYYAYGAVRGGSGYGRCRRDRADYRSDPPGGVIQDRDYQEEVLGVPFC